MRPRTAISLTASAILCLTLTSGAQGVTVICCYVTNRDITAPRTPPNTTRWGWSRGAKRMFDGASPVENDHPQVARLRSSRWSITPGSRYFVQVNHSTVLADLVEAALAIP